SRAQSVFPRGSLSPGFTVTRVVPVLLMSRGLPGRYDPACILFGDGHDHEQNMSVSDANNLDPLFLIDEPVIDRFDAIRIFEGCDGIEKINAVLAKIFSSFAIIPFILHN